MRYVEYTSISVGFGILLYLADHPDKVVIIAIDTSPQGSGELTQMTPPHPLEGANMASG